MLSNVQRTKLLRVCAALMMLSSGCLFAYGQKTCECGEPSLGTVTCEDDQEPFCVVKSGKVHGRCKSKGNRNGAQLERWILTEALGRPVTDAELRDPSVQQGMLSGRVQLTNADGKLVWVTFRPLKGGAQFSPMNQDLQNQLEKKKKSENESVQTASMASSESNCEVCVELSGATHCKTIASQTEKELKATRAELCGSDQSCLDRPPSIKCKPR